MSCFSLSLSPHSAFFDNVSCAVLRSNFVQQSFGVLFFAMKRSAAEAGFPAEGQAVRVTVCLYAFLQTDALGTNL